MPVKKYDGTNWITVAGNGEAGAPGTPGAPGTSSSIATWVKTASGGETSVSGTGDTGYGTLAYTVGQELVFMNGTLLDRGDDYIATTGTSITGLTALTAGDVITVWTVNSFSVANTYTIAQADAAFAPINTGMTVIQSGSLTGSSVSITGIPNTYKNLQLVLRDFYPSVNDRYTSFQVNGDTGSNYVAGGFRTKTGQNEFTTGTNTTYGDLSSWPVYGTDNNNQANITFYDYANTSTYKIVSGVNYSYYRSGNDMGLTMTVWKNTSAITSIQIFTDSSTFSGGTYILYGVK